MHPGWPIDTDRARALGKQLLFYIPSGPLGGTFSCALCGVSATQPDLLDHRAGACPYASEPGPPQAPHRLPDVFPSHPQEPST